MDVSVLRQRVHKILEPEDRETRASAFFNIFITAVILLSIAVMVFSSVHSLWVKYSTLFSVVFFFTTIVFSIEYPLRLWSCTADPRFASPVRGRLAWAITPFALIDLLVVFPFYLDIFFGINITGLVVLRVFRVFKLIRYSDSINTITRVVRAQKDMLITAYLVLFIALISASTLMFQIENPVQPDKFTSIPATMWWGIVTLATVGYGDIVPVTAAGKIFGGFIILIGIGIFALPAGILASGFTQELQKKMAKARSGHPGSGGGVYLCPHCKSEIPESELWRKQ